MLKIICPAISPLYTVNFKKWTVPLKCTAWGATRKKYNIFDNFVERKRGKKPSNSIYAHGWRSLVATAKHRGWNSASTATRFTVCPLHIGSSFHLISRRLRHQKNVWSDLRLSKIEKYEIAAEAPNTRRVAEYKWREKVSSSVLHWLLTLPSSYAVERDNFSSPFCRFRAVEGRNSDMFGFQMVPIHTEQTGLVTCSEHKPVPCCSSISPF